MKGIVVLAICGSLLLQSGVFAQSSFTCDPEDDCATAGADSKVPDPENCKNYYLCVTDPSGNVIPSPSPIACPDGQYFDTTTEACIDGTTCVNTCAGSGTKPNEGCRTTCSTSTNTSTSVIADVNDCSVYHICLDEVIVNTVTCEASALYFNGITCVADETQCCDFCEPYCWDAGTLLQDPADCSSFYTCAAEGTPDSHGSCPSGKYFEPSTYQCVTGTCTNICSSSSSGVTTAAGTTTTTAATTTAAAATTTAAAATTTAAAATTTAAAAATTTATATTTASCKSLSEFTCPNPTGNYARCNYCDLSYFRCVAGIASIQYCLSFELFNPIEEWPYCLLADNCPYTPP